MIPLLVDYTHEDKAAKGLRRGEAAKLRPVHFTALEVVAEAKLLLLTAPRGGGKTTLARWLAAHLPGDVAGLAADVPRNEDGDVLPQGWSGPAPRVVFHPHEIGEGHTLLILDGAEALAPSVLDHAVMLATRHPDLRVLLLGESDPCDGWPLPAGFRRHRLLPLFGVAPAFLRHPGLHAMARRVGVAAGAAAQVDRYLAHHDDMNDQRFVRDHIAARELAGEAPAAIAARFRADPVALAPVLLVLAERAPALMPALAAALVETPEGAVLAAELHGEAPGLAAALWRVVEGGLLSIPRRVVAGRHLARLGDPRDLEELVKVPGGGFTMGSALHPNSVPPHEARVAAFRIMRYPVTNALYRRFVAATGRAWRSADGLRAELANVPAVDLTWHDARACCAWLTSHWRAAGRIAPDEIARLPTEPEWEHAARGEQPDASHHLYPWRGAWAPDHANSEEAGLNAPCAVGLFPRGRAACGAEDMTGQVWEWCATLWGTEMGTPSFAYPYRDDGRENADEPATTRRVLRGGCFSSGREKATCSYRGSLEPDGFWRGNGFRVLVAKG